MSRFRATAARSNAVLSALVLTLLAGAAACDDDGKTAPEGCVDPAPYDIQAGAPADAEPNPCVNGVGHAINQGAATPTAGSTVGGAATGGKSGGSAMAGAGAGGAP